MVRNPYLFIVGCARSGTTLLQRMLDHHPLLAVANEARLLLPITENGNKETDPQLIPELIEQLRGHHRFSKLGLPEMAVSEAAASARTYGEFVSYLYSEYGRLRGKLLAGEKTPQYVRFLPRLHALFPWVHTLQLIRDGRDVALSTRQWVKEHKGPGRFELWREEPVGVCALWWKWQVSAGRRDGAMLGPKRYYEVRYEDLVTSPERTLTNITEFLELAFAGEMLSYHKGKVRSDSKLSSKKAWLPPTQGLRDWRSQMPARDVELFEAIAGDLLSTLGYERAFITISPAIARTSERCCNWWEEEIARRSLKRARRRSSISQPQPCSTA